MSRQYPARPIASAAAVVLRGDEVLLVQRGMAPRRGIWTFPGGAIEVGESAREACAREIFEETGLTIEVGPVIDVVDVMEQDGDLWRYHYTIIDFLAKPAPECGPLCAATDACDARWVKISEIGQYNLDPIALHVLERGLWLRENGMGPLAPHGAKTYMGRPPEG